MYIILRRVVYIHRSDVLINVEEAGFGIKRYHEKTYVKWLNCTREGASASSNSPIPKEHNRGTKRGGCKVGMKLRKHLNSNKEVTSVTIEVFEALHNHPMLTKQAAKHCYSAKKRDPTYKEFINQLNDARVPHSSIINLMENIHGDPENMPLTSRDMQNM